MAFFIGIVAMLQMLVGMAAYGGAKSAIHEILGALSFGMGILSFALAVVIVKLNDIKKANEETAAATLRLRDLQLKVAEAFDRIARR